MGRTPAVALALPSDDVSVASTGSPPAHARPRGGPKESELSIIHIARTVGSRFPKLDARIRATVLQAILDSPNSGLINRGLYT